MDKVEYVSLKQIADNPKYPFSMGQLRHYLMHRHKNNLDSAVRKIGKRLFLRMDLFDAWIEKQTGDR
ncbi:MAG: hypothetical protein NTZ52_03255 [Chlamydiae bacterium]|nr:hypothetical protein [Chlamydiota bacterium]